MALRVYLMPMTATGTRTGSFAAKYASLLPNGCPVLDGGFENLCLVAADVTPAQNTALVANTDVVAAPANLAQQVGASLTAVQNALESLNVPADWITSGMTYSFIVRVIATLFLFLQRLQIAGTGTLFTGGITLNSTFSQLPAGVRTALIQAAQSLGYSTASLSGSSTIRACLKAMADQWSAVNPVYMGQVQV